MAATRTARTNFLNALQKTDKHFYSSPESFVVRVERSVWQGNVEFWAVTGHLFRHFFCFGTFYEIRITSWWSYVTDMQYLEGQEKFSLPGSWELPLFSQVASSTTPNKQCLCSVYAMGMFCNFARDHLSTCTSWEELAYPFICPHFLVNCKHIEHNKNIPEAGLYKWCRLLWNHCHLDGT